MLETGDVSRFAQAGNYASYARCVDSARYSNGKRRTTMPYVDGFALPVPTANLAAYRRMAKKAGAVWREHGALEYNECIADDVKPGKVTSFPQSVKLKDGETVVFAWIVYKSRKDRDRINAKVMADPQSGA